MGEGTEVLYNEFAKELTPEWMAISAILETDNFTLWCAASAIQLALRHPDFNGPTAERARAFAMSIFAGIARTPALQKVAELGWNSDYDMTFVNFKKKGA